MPHDQITITARAFSPLLQEKIDLLKSRRCPISLGSVNFDSPLILAPMSAICTAPFRLLMEDLGAGGTVSELISCHGINYKNKKTTEMLRLDPREKNVGLQLFGEDGYAMGEAAKVAQEFGAKFIDINMGCPVKKVVTKGGGSALLRETTKLAPFFNQIKKSIQIPLTIKIRVGWDDNSLNASEVIHIAKESGIEFVAIHGRTRAQAYTGHARWDFVEEVAKNSPLPVIGNGDLHTPYLVRQRLRKTTCQALMLGRGPLRNPFIFLESLKEENEDLEFFGADYLEVIKRYFDYLVLSTDNERTISIQIRKMMVWFSAGFPNVTYFRGKVFELYNYRDSLNLAEDYFLGLEKRRKFLPEDEAFMAGGHG